MDTNLMVHVIFESHWKLSLAVKTAHGITTFFFLNTEDFVCDTWLFSCPLQFYLIHD